MDLSLQNVKDFFGAASRSDKPAVAAFDELRTRGCSSQYGHPALKEIERHAQRSLARHGKKLNQVTAGELAELFNINGRAS